MKLYYYCSYKFSPTGFQLQCIDEHTGAVIPYNSENEDDRLIQQLFSHGGIESAFGRLENRRYYFFIKQLQKTDDTLSESDKGQHWNINFAVSADISDLTSLCAVAYLAYTNVTVFTDLLYHTLSLGDEQASFRVDTALFQELLQQASHAIQADSTPYNPPYALNPDLLSSAVNLLKTQHIQHQLEFVILTATPAYFYKNCRISSRTKIWHGVSLSGETIFDFSPVQTPLSSPTVSQYDDDWSNKAAWALIGIATVTATVVISKCVFGRGKRRK